MSIAKESFGLAISDAGDLLRIYDSINGKDVENQQPPEVLKRAALVMILTAWETYVEDIATEKFEQKFSVLKGSRVGDFVEQQFSIKLKMFHNPDSLKTKQIFEEFFGVDVTNDWVWGSYSTSKEVKTTLNRWISRRGSAVHRAYVDKNAPHLVNRKDLDKCILFFNDLVNVTDKTLSKM
ncbi:HEPN domain-containing protein [Pelagibaculum spongiae]|uniref:RiboL-PSP-HEPN domain-containing protein n=1 Tax=Pelagibaculum spongiae TaxID=2080658 RepID=A0A2V1GYH9_9GAMM|nr:HEPN domain-containing protein [Pelagibaculum spongiae]PVZ72124.1 hypothetical protein DC094_03665 [Pelagibaculum spongiae]